MKRISAPEQTREQLRALIEGRLGASHAVWPLFELYAKWHKSRMAPHRLKPLVMPYASRCTNTAGFFSRIEGRVTAGHVRSISVNTRNSIVSL
jgi:hypothetical protein